MWLIDNHILQKSIKNITINQRYNWRNILLLLIYFYISSLMLIFAMDYIFSCFKNNRVLKYILEFWVYSFLAMEMLHT